MRIEIRDRFRPYTDQRGAKTLLPGSSLGLEVYPAKIFLYDLCQMGEQVAEIDIDLIGPCREFITQLDLERGAIGVFLQCGGKKIRYFIFYRDGKVFLKRDKPEADRAFFNVLKDPNHLIALHPDEPVPQPSTHLKDERISFGSHKKQYMDDALRRSDPEEIFPLWHALARQIPETQGSLSEDSLLGEAHAAILAKNKEDVVLRFREIIKAGVSSLFFPKMQDSLYQGFKEPVLRGNLPLSVITEGGRLIRSLCIQTTETKVCPLPLIPSCLSSGRMTGVDVMGAASCSLEWRSGRLTKMSFLAAKPCTIDLVLPKNVQGFRARNCKTHETRLFKRDTPIDLQEGLYLFLDRFQH